MTNARQFCVGEMVDCPFLFWGHLLSVELFSNELFKKKIQEYHQCQTVWIKIRPDILSGLIWDQNVSKDYQQTTLAGLKLRKL